MRLNETEATCEKFQRGIIFYGVNNYLQPFFGRYEDSFQQAWVDILECNPQTAQVNSS